MVECIIAKNPLFVPIASEFNDRSTNYCIDLLFANQPNLLTKSGVHPSLRPRCQYQVIFVKFSLKVEYPPSCECLIWEYQNADIPSINCATDIFDWGNTFKGKNVHEQVYIFNKKILSIFRNYICKKTIFL